MLNQDLLSNDPSLKYKLEIKRLKEVISKFKKYDEERTKFYESKLKRLQKLEDLYNDPEQSLQRIQNLEANKDQLKKENRKLRGLVELYELDPYMEYSEISREYVLLYKENERLKALVKTLRESRDSVMEQLASFI